MSASNSHLAGYTKTRLRMEGIVPRSTRKSRISWHGSKGVSQSLASVLHEASSKDKTRAASRGLVKPHASTR